jgi:hypothetical protein
MSQQSHRKPSVQIPCLPPRPVFDGTGRVDSQRSIVLYFHLKEMSIHVIHDDLVITLGNKALAYSAVTKYLRKVQSDTAKVPSNRDTSLPHLDDSNRAILAALEESPFRQCASLSEPPISCLVLFTED